ncbi:peroxide stress protein YaaA, partial [Eggerthia catenaformis]
MRIILSPAKNMIFDDSLGYSDLPVYLTKSYKLLNYLQSLSYEELKELWKCNDKLALLNQERIRMM